MGHDVDAIYDQGVVEENEIGNKMLPTAKIVSPRLIHPEHAADFKMEVRDLLDTGA